MSWWHKMFSSGSQAQPHSGNGVEDALSGSDVLKRLVSMSEMRVDAFMTPRADIVAAEVRTEPSHILKRMREHRVEIVPLYRERLDHIVGCVRAWDLALLVAEKKEGVKPETLLSDLETPLYVAASARVLDVFVQMRTHKTHAAIVLDEYGGVDGLVMMDDLMAAVSKEISRLRGQKQNWSWTEEGKDAFLVDARCRLEELEKVIGPLRHDDAYRDYDTVGGLVVGLVGRVPDRGEVVMHDKGWEFEILDVDMRRIRRVRLRRTAPDTLTPAAQTRQ